MNQKFPLPAAVELIKLESVTWELVRVLSRHRRSDQLDQAICK